MVRYKELALMQRVGQISGLELQPRYLCEIGDVLICAYVADFRYRDEGGGALVVEDVKGFKTPVYKLKKKLVEAIYGLEILET